MLDRSEKSPKKKVHTNIFKLKFAVFLDKHSWETKIFSNKSFSPTKIFFFGRVEHAQEIEKIVLLSGLPDRDTT